MSGIFKGLYRNHGIYWFGSAGYGDETNPMFSTIGQMRAAIDAKIAAELAVKMTPVEEYWESIPSDERRKWRQLAGQSDLSASELAFNAR